MKSSLILGVLFRLFIPSVVGTKSLLCDPNAKENESYDSYFHGLKSVYGLDDSLYKCYRECGWPQSGSVVSNLPTLVVAVGLEGAGHKMWMSSIFDSLSKADPTICSSEVDSTQAFGFNNDFPVLSSEDLAESIRRGFSHQGKEGCRLFIDMSQTFPAGNKKQTGRVMRHADLINLQQLHGVIFNVKYFIVLRNVVENAMISLARQTTRTMDHNLRSIEMSLVYLENALQRIPCHQKFLAHFEMFRENPRSFVAPLKSFLGLNDNISYKEASKHLEGRIEIFAKQKKSLPKLKIPRELVQKLCGRKDSDKKCNKEVQLVYEKFFSLRNHMWPTFAGDISIPTS